MILTFALSVFAYVNKTDISRITVNHSVTPLRYINNIYLSADLYDRFLILDLNCKTFSDLDIQKHISTVRHEVKLNYKFFNVVCVILFTIVAFVVRTISPDVTA